MGPFLILSQVNSVSYKLKLPNMHISPVFHVSLFRAVFHESFEDRVANPTLLETLDGSMGYSHTFLEAGLGDGVSFSRSYSRLRALPPLCLLMSISAPPSLWCWLSQYSLSWDMDQHSACFVIGFCFTFGHVFHFWILTSFVIKDLFGCGYPHNVLSSHAQ